MKYHHFRFVILIIIGLFPLSIIAQNEYDKNVNRYKSAWEKLIPTHGKLQFAGDMGLLSFGIGWDYGKNDKWETDIFFGFVPKYETDKFKVTFTLKQNYMPWNCNFGEKFSLEPLACGIYLNTVFGGDFWTKEPDRYPSGYYGFSSKVRIHAFVGQRFTYNIDYKYRKRAKAITLFYEISTCDVYLISAVRNSHLKPDDYLRLSFGIKLQRF